MIRRILKLKTKIVCCREDDEDIIYHPDENIEIYTEEADRFDTSLEQWGEENAEALCAQLKEEGEDECAGLGTDAYLCSWICKIIDFTEEIIGIIVPPEIIEAIKGYERSAKALRDAAEKLKAIPELKEDFEKRAEELENKAKELRKKYGLEGKVL